MLVLSRFVGQTLYIGDDITVMVTEISGGRVSLGINAPKKIPVHREEIYLKVQMEAKLKPEGEQGARG